MEQHLASEDIQVFDNQVQGFAQLFWDPLQTAKQLVGS